MKNERNVLHAFTASSIRNSSQTVNAATVITNGDGEAIARLSSVMPVSGNPGVHRATKRSTLRASLVSLDTAAGIIRGTGRAETKYVLHTGSDGRHAFALAKAGTSSIDGASFMLPETEDEPWWAEALADARSMAKAVRRGHVTFIPGSEAVITAAISEDEDMGAAHAALLLSGTYGAELGYMSASFRRGSMDAVSAVARMARAIAAASKAKTVVLEGDDGLINRFNAAFGPENKAGGIPIRAVPLANGPWSEKFDGMRSIANALSDGCRNAAV